MSFYHLPNPWDPGYAVPEYVMAEPPERGTFTTKWLPRGTISTVVPDFLVRPTAKKLLGRNDAGLGMFEGIKGSSTPLLMVAGVGLVAYLLLRKKK